MAGGTGSRLAPLTNVMNKHLLPVYNKPMIYYPLFSMREAGVTDVMIVSGKGHAGSFLELLGSGEKMGMHLEYAVQEEPGGIAQALGLARGFVGKENFIVILGDNVVEDNLRDAVASFKDGAKVFLKEVENPQAYGVAEVAGEKIISIEEKPKNPKSNLAVIGVYMYEAGVFEVIDGLKPSKRGELEITDVNNFYLKADRLNYELLKGFWGDCGESFDSLMKAAEMVRKSRLSGIFEEKSS